jgi:hypothetical protein
MSAQAPAMTRDSSPAHDVLENFLYDALKLSVEDRGQQQAEIELRIDILYLLTDKIAHRRALPLRVLIEELRNVQVPDRPVPSLSESAIKRVLYRLSEQRLVREFEAPNDNHYELAHDFLVRFVVRHYHLLERKRIAEFALRQRQRDDAEAELKRLSAVERSVFMAIRVLPLAILTVSVWLIFLGAHERLPNKIGLSILWFIACPAAALCLLGALTARWNAAVMGAMGLVFCGGIWNLQMSLPSVDVRSLEQFNGTTLYSVSLNPNTVSFNPLAVSRACNTLVALEFGVRSLPYSKSSLEQTCEKRLGQSNLLAHLIESPSDHFCGHMPDVFSTSVVGKDCMVNSSQWKDEFVRAVMPPTGFTLRPHQLNRLDSDVGSYSLVFAVLQIMIFPIIWASTFPRGGTVRIALRRICTELIDVVLCIALAVVFHRPEYLLNFILHPSLILEWFADYWWQPLPGLALYALISSFVLKFAGATPGGLLAGMRTGQQNGKAGIIRLFVRQIVSAVWTYFDLFGGVPSLLITPFYVWRSRNHQLIYDSLLGLQTEPQRQSEQLKPEPSPLKTGHASLSS